MQSPHSPQRQIHSDIPLIMSYDDVFTHEECQSFIQLSQQYDYEVATISVDKNQFKEVREVRNNQRVIYDSPELADQLFTRLKPLLPNIINDWQLAGLNERFRFYLYEQGQTFKPHYDASYERNRWCYSFLTLLIYLSEDFGGGETIFYREVGRFGATDDSRRAVIVPRLGQVLLFEHRQLHEGATVTCGQKYVLRTDVMYRHRLA